MAVVLENQLHLLRVAYQHEVVGGVEQQTIYHRFLEKPGGSESSPCRETFSVVTSSVEGKPSEEYEREFMLHGATNCVHFLLSVFREQCGVVMTDFPCFCLLIVVDLRVKGHSMLSEQVFLGAVQILEGVLLLN